VAQAGYTFLSHKARADVSTPLYSTVSSLVCGLELLVICRLAHVPLTGFDTSTHLSLLGLLVLPQLLGLGSMNFALGRVSATTMSVLLLLETPVAALAAWLLMGQGIQAAAYPGLLLTIVGVMVVVTSGDTAGAGEAKTAPPQSTDRRRIPYYAPYPLPTARGTQRLPTPRESFLHAWERSRGGLPEEQWGEHEHDTLALVLRAAGPHQQPSHGHDARHDPRAGWAGADTDFPTITFSYHGAGAFGALPASTPPPPDPGDGLDMDTVPLSDTAAAAAWRSRGHRR
jgi:hypothetical protein